MTPAVEAMLAEFPGPVLPRDFGEGTMSGPAADLVRVAVLAGWDGSEIMRRVTRSVGAYLQRRGAR